MAFSSSFADALNLGYDAATPKQDKNNKTAYQRYIEKFYGPGVTSHRDPLAVARAATGAVAQGLKTGGGFLAHAAAGLLGAPMGPSQQGSRAAANATNAPQQGAGGIGSDTGAVSGITPTNRLYGGNPGTGAGISAYDPGSTRQGMDGVLDAISRAEGTTRNGYNTILGEGAYGRPSKPITDMTLNEVYSFGRNTLGPNWSAKTGKPMSTATGRYQITGTNIKNYATKWGLDMATTKWSPQLQDRIAIDMVKNTPKALANWEGFKSNPKLKQQALAALQGKNVSSTVASTAYSGDPQVAQLQKDLAAQGAKITVDGIMGPQTRKAMNQYPDTASAYAPTSATTSPAIRAATEEAAGQTGGGRAPTPDQQRESGTISRRGESVAAMQRDLNSRGAKLTVDGLEGPLTRQAAQQFYGSPTSVRTPSFTSTPATTSNNWSSLQGSPTRTVNQRQDYVPTPSFTNQQSYTSGRGDEGRGVPAPLSAQPRQVSTQAIDASGYPPIQNGFVRPDVGPAIRTPIPSVPQTPYLNNPYTMGTGGANAIVQPAQTARIPRPRPDQAVPVSEGGTILEQLQQQLQHVTEVVGQIGGQISDAARSGGMGQSFSGAQNSGLGYVGGRGYGGGSINRGTGGAINPNR